MRTTKKMLCMILAVVMVLGLLPVVASATEVEYVYISASEEGEFIADSNGNKLAYRAVPLDALSAIDLNEYGLSDYLYDKDGDGNYEITALHLYIYTHEVILGGDWNDVTISGGAGSIYFSNGLFGYEDENLRYNYNGAYPADENGWGFTADQIVLSDGDYFDVAHYTDWMFYSDSAYGFHYFTDESDAINISCAAEVGTALSLKLTLVGGGMGGGDTYTPEAGYTVYYGQSVGNATDSVVTDDSGAFSVTFPSAGTWYVWCDGGEGVDMAAGSKVSSPACAAVTVSATEQPRQAQDVSAVLNATMAQLASTVTEPVFGTNAGEWTVLSLARGNYYAKDNAYFTDYYDRIVETVNTTAASVNMSGALHKNKSTENSRLIVALSAIGKDATSVGDWNLVEAYSANGFSWIKKQGLNGTIWALIALDSNNYATTDTTIRQQCIDAILSLQHDDGGWSLMANKTFASDPDITGMALTALYPYRDQPEVAVAAEEAFACLSAMQHDNGTFASGGSECSESCAWVIVSATTWGINPDTDSRFIKNGNSVVDALLTHYLEDSATFQHIVGAGSNAMATDQSCYALVAYDRFLNSEKALFDYSDVTFDASSVVQGKPAATLGLPAQIPDDAGKTFNAVITLDQWDNTASYKLIDLVVNVPAGLRVTGVAAGSRLNGGEVSYHLDNGKLRVVYFDANNHGDITIINNAEGNTFPALFFTVTFCVDSVSVGDSLNISLDAMSIKKSSDSAAEDAMIDVEITTAGSGTIEVIQGISYSAVCLYTGNGTDLIPSGKKAVAVSVVGIENATMLTYDDGVNTYIFLYSAEISDRTGIDTYVALVDASIAMEQFAEKQNFTFTEEAASQITFGDINGDDVINAQDALDAVNAWLRKSGALSDEQILIININGDACINTFDALGIVEKFVDGSEYGVVTKAATITTQQ